MNYYGFPPGYSPDTADPLISAILAERAKRAGATHLVQQGKRITFYHFRLGVWWSSSPSLESWWKCDGRPEGMVEL